MKPSKGSSPSKQNWSVSASSCDGEIGVSQWQLGAGDLFVLTLENWVILGTEGERNHLQYYKSSRESLKMPMAENWRATKEEGQCS